MRFTGLTNRRYDALQLVERDVSLLASVGECDTVLICDLDKTYLETEFESFFDLARVAIQGPEDKISVSGAMDLLRFFKFSVADAQVKGRRQLHFISSSPPQLRRVITEKLQMDGLYWDSLTLKNQLYNLTHGKPERLRDHVSYKLLAIGMALQEVKAGGGVSLIGDFAEFDAFVYGTVAFFLDQRPSVKEMKTFLREANVDGDSAESIASLFSALPSLRVENVFIRVLGNYNSIFQMPLSGMIWTFDHFVQVAAKLFADGILLDHDFTALFSKMQGPFPGLGFGMAQSVLENMLSNNAELESIITVRSALSPLLEVGGYAARLLTVEEAARSHRYPPRRLEQPFQFYGNDFARLENMVMSYYRKLAVKRFAKL